MKLSELVAKYGDENVGIQPLDQCVSDINYNHKKGTSAKFVTDQPVGLDGFKKIGMIIWFDREKLDAIIAEERNNQP